jgi:3-hydroxyacyl-CoA dehydrogenase
MVTFNERKLTILSWRNDGNKKLGIIGFGQMGCGDRPGLRAGWHDVEAVDSSEAMLAKGIKGIEKAPGPRRLGKTSEADKNANVGEDQNEHNYRDLKTALI